MKAPYIFVHVPKTAGTSLRVALEKAIGLNHIVYDYGKQSDLTSDIVLQHMYGQQDLWAFSRALSRRQGRLISGHFSASKYARHYGLASSIVFLREPYERAVSEYKHALSHHGYEGTFRAFFERKPFHNRQSEFLAGMPIPAFGVLGLTERYPESLQLVAEFLDMDLNYLDINKEDPQKSQRSVIEAGDREAFYQLNKKDVALYKRASEWFDITLPFLQAGTEFVRGWLTTVSKSRVSGVAWCSQSARPALVVLLVNGEVVAQRRATEYSASLVALNLPRHGNVAFNFGRLNLKAGDVVEVRASDLMQPLYHSKRVVK